jgi:hypothetical protein
MSGVLGRLVSAFVVPEDTSAHAARPAPPPPPVVPAIAVLGAGDHALAAGAAVALALSGGPVVVAIVGESRRPALRAPATRGARKLAERLAARGHHATVSGRIVTVALEAPHEALRVAAAADLPVVTVAAAPRDGDVDRVLAAHDRVIVAGADLIADLAAHSVAGLGVRADVVALPDAPAARALAVAGLALAAPWRAAVEDALR